MKIATEAITDPYGGLYTHTQRLKRYSRHSIHEIPSRGTLFFINRNRWLRRLYREHCLIRGFDILHSRADPWFINVCRRSKTTNNVWVHTYHALYFEHEYMNGFEPWQKETNEALLSVASRADIKLCVSQWCQKLLKEKYGIITTYLPNGVDVENYRRAKADRFIQKFCLKDFILFVGNYREVKFPQRFLDLAQRMPDQKFVMVGDGISAENLISLYHVQVPSNVTLLGRLNHDDVLDAMAECKTYVMTSKSEGIPNSLLEAMALAKPVVVPAHTGCLELVPSNEYGFLFDLNSIDQLVEQTRNAIHSVGTGEKARERVLKFYDWRDSAKQLDDIYSNAKKFKIFTLIK